MWCWKLPLVDLFSDPHILQISSNCCLFIDETMLVLCAEMLSNTFGMSALFGKGLFLLCVQCVSPPTTVLWQFLFSAAFGWLFLPPSSLSHLIGMWVFIYILLLGRCQHQVFLSCSGCCFSHSHWNSYRYCCSPVSSFLFQLFFKG